MLRISHKFDYSPKEQKESHIPLTFKYKAATALSTPPEIATATLFRWDIFLIHSHHILKIVIRNKYI